jgi:hypothetical protein
MQFQNIHERDGKWYFWDGDWKTEHGPFDSQAQAEREFSRYCREMLCKTCGD